MNQFEEVDYWKAIILYGLNQATYKIALGKTLLELTQHNSTEIDWSTLSRTYLDNYIQRLHDSPLPQQSNPARKTVMERIVGDYKMGALTYDQAVDKVAADAFNDVIPRFQTIGTDKLIIKDKFYNFDHGKKLYLHDTLFKINEDHRDELITELDARWGLLEGAFSLAHGDWELINDIRDIYIQQYFGKFYYIYLTTSRY